MKKNHRRHRQWRVEASNRAGGAIVGPGVGVPNATRMGKEASTSTKPLRKSGVDGVAPVVVVTALSRAREKKRSVRIWGLGFSPAKPPVVAGVDAVGLADGTFGGGMVAWWRGVMTWWCGGCGRKTNSLLSFLLFFIYLLLLLF